VFRHNSVSTSLHCAASQKTVVFRHNSVSAGLHCTASQKTVVYRQLSFYQSTMRSITENSRLQTTQFLPVYTAQHHRKQSFTDNSVSFSLHCAASQKTVVFRHNSVSTSLHCAASQKTVVFRHNSISTSLHCTASQKTVMFRHNLVSASLHCAASQKTVVFRHNSVSASLHCTASQKTVVYRQLSFYQSTLHSIPENSRLQTTQFLPVYTAQHPRKQSCSDNRVSTSLHCTASQKTVVYRQLSFFQSTLHSIPENSRV
jgi:hypothetical protein